MIGVCVGVGDAGRLLATTVEGDGCRCPGRGRDVGLLDGETIAAAMAKAIAKGIAFVLLEMTTAAAIAKSTRMASALVWRW